MKHLYTIVIMVLTLIGGISSAHAESFEEYLSQAQLPLLTEEQVQQYIQRFPQPAKVQMAFEETRTLPPLVRPLVSKGKILLLKDKGIVWQRETPFVLTTVITKDNIQQWVGDKRTESMTDKPVYLTSLARNLTDIFSGRYDKVLRDFEIKGQLSDTTWVIALEPRLALVKQYVSGIVLRGEEYPLQVDIYEKDGKHTHVMLSQHSVSIDPVLQHALIP